MPVEVEKIIERPIPVPTVVEKIVQVPQVIEKVVEVVVENTRVNEVERVVEKVVPAIETRVVQENKVVVQEKIKEVPSVKEKVVPVKEVVREQVPVQQIIEKIIEKTIEIPKVVEVERIIEKMVEKHQIVELETIVPQLVKVHEVVKEFVDKVVEIPIREEIIKEVQVEIEKVVQVAVENTNVQQIEVIKEKPVEVQKIVEVVNSQNYIESQVQVVDRFEQKEVPVYTTVEKIVEVPQVLEKIVERIVVMPQVVEVLKYVHEICETDSLGVAIEDLTVQQQELKFKQVYTSTKQQMEVLIAELRKISSREPSLRVLIEIIEKFLVDFDKLASLRRVVGVNVDKIVEKEVNKPILVPTKDADTVRNELALSLLVEKLIKEIKRIKSTNSSIRLELDEELNLIFFPETGSSVGGSFQNDLSRYTTEAIAKLNSLGGNWTHDHEFMLHTILQERFTMASLIKQANLEIEKVKAISEKRGVALREKETQFEQAAKALKETHKTLEELIKNNHSISTNTSITRIFESLNSFVTTDFAIKLEEPLKIIGDFIGSGNDWNRIQSALREKDDELIVLRQKITDIEKSHLKREFSGVNQDRTVSALRQENQDLARQIDQLRSASSTSGNNRELETKLRTEQTKVQELQSKLRTAELEVKQLKDMSSSAASSRVDNYTSGQTGAKLTSSQYSSESGNSGRYGQSGGNTSTTNPSYGNYRAETTTTEKVSYSSTSNYGTNNQGSSYGTSSGYGTTGSRAYGTSGTGNTALSGSGVRGSTTGSTSYGSTTYGNTGTYGSSSGNYGSSNLRSSQTGSGSGSSYNYQTKRN